MGNRLQVTAIGGVVVTVSVGIGLMLWAWFGLNWPFALLAGVASLGVQLPLVAASMRRLKPGRVRLPSASAALAPSTHAGPSFHAAPPFHAGAADPALASRLEAVEAGLRTLAQRIWQIDQRITELDRQALERTRDTVAAVASELDMVGSVVRDDVESKRPAVSSRDLSGCRIRQRLGVGPGQLDDFASEAASVRVPQPQQQIGL